MTLLAVALGGGFGALARFAVTRAVRSPWGVLIVNAVGSAVAGVVLALARGGGLDDAATTALIAGFAGGLTTFSTFGVETLELLRDGRSGVALLSVSANLVLGIGLAVAGYVLTAAAFWA
ncbi:fluoride efflux transporter FluC [Ruicaihuangia caeni]|uniref:fluoride efflux transporter FluC n=1 Tax=Ruicaihuangia caeni TaxID=3042517 RepID=UPI00338F0683